ncbi:PREDICTED: somatomedin-B and thrombospondin type-1 domain-containing protein [Tinamus guttatus]|uniref:somatomedin-B and thrombospondin type-1 domain-containing protein n=1 Tax=Tinamus guttatus TaxID=94827 RepID=UPI00052F1A06|nr:PREDICTED: somatomedin-B and thrombospondin type-1 domain-containing protein [Tinamus guttatus]
MGLMGDVVAQRQRATVDAGDCSGELACGCDLVRGVAVERVERLRRALQGDVSRAEAARPAGAAEPCRAPYRVRRRHVLREPRNGGEPCPALEERAGCMEYWSLQGAECKQSLLPALITTGGFGKARRKRAAADGNERAGYCVEFQLVAITPGCLRGHRSHTLWMRYLREGHTVCVECQHPALDPGSLHCYGDGSGSQQNQLLHWEAVGSPQCRGTWKRIRQLDTCSCPSVHSFLFI